MMEITGNPRLNWEIKNYPTRQVANICKNNTDVSTDSINLNSASRQLYVHIYFVISKVMEVRWKIQLGSYRCRKLSTASSLKVKSQTFNTILWLQGFIPSSLKFWLIIFIVYDPDLGEKQREWRENNWSS